MPDEILNQPVTVENMIDWITEQIFHIGKIRYSTEWKPQDVLMNTSIDMSVSTAEAAATETSVDTALANGIATWNRDEELNQLIRANKNLLPAVFHELNRQLCATGLSKYDIDILNSDNSGLRGKVEALFKLEHPELLPTPRVAVYVIKEESGKMMREMIWLPKEAPFIQIAADLRIAMTSAASTNENAIQGGTWLYQFVDKELKISKIWPRMPLKSSLDYKIMIKRITRENSATPTAVLVHVGGNGLFFDCTGHSNISTQDSIMRRLTRPDPPKNNAKLVGASV